MSSQGRILNGGYRGQMLNLPYISSTTFEPEAPFYQFNELLLPNQRVQREKTIIIQCRKRKSFLRVLGVQVVQIIKQASSGSKMAVYTRSSKLHIFVQISYVFPGPKFAGKESALPHTQFARKYYQSAFSKPDQITCEVGRHSRSKVPASSSQSSEVQ